ncbi:MAG: ATP-binding protein [Gemmatimonadota bacterium]
MTSVQLATKAPHGTDAPAIDELLATATTAVRDLLDRCAPGDPMKARLLEVQQTMERLSALTSSLDSRVTFRPHRAASLDLNAMVEEMAAPFQRLLGPFITLETTLHRPALWTAGDRRQLEQVALGLIINAREALPLGGKVRLATRRLVIDRPMQYRIGTLGSGTWAVLEVRDNGAGAEDRGVHHLLEPATRGRQFDSSMSLSAVSSAVTEAGGQVVLDNPDGGGTILAACFPAVQPPRIRQPATGTASAVMIVDNDEWSRMSAARTLRQAGFGVLEAGHTDDALELLDDVAGSCVRLMVIDGGMLDSGPRPLGERIRRERPEIELLVTASHRSSTGGDGRSAVLTKPFSSDDLLRAIRERFLTLS